MAKAKGFDPGVSITRELIADNPDAALEHIHMLLEQSEQSSSVIEGLQQAIDQQKGTRDALDRMTEEHAMMLRAGADKDAEVSRLTTELADSSAQRTSLLSGRDEALAAYREQVLAANPQLPPALISGGTLNEIQTSVEAARGVVQHVQAAIQSSNQNSRMPSGAPMRPTAPDPSSMTRTEKILYGVRQSHGEEMTG